MHSALHQEGHQFDEHHVLHELHHYLPAQAPLKDFVHHNTLHAFQSQPFNKAIRGASEILGYNVSLKLNEYRDLYAQGRIREEILKDIIKKRKGENRLELWWDKVTTKQFEESPLPRIGKFRSNWKKKFRVDLDSMVHPLLFRLLCSYLDQGISIWKFPVENRGFLSALRRIEKTGGISIFKSKRVRELIKKPRLSIKDVLDVLVGDERFFGTYIFDQQFAHSGWSGIVSSIEQFPESLIDKKKISLHDLIIIESLMEIDALDRQIGKDWQPLALAIDEEPEALFAPVTYSELHEVLSLWQEAFEFSYYDQVFAGIQQKDKQKEVSTSKPSFQGFFCIDDRECSFRRYLEEIDTTCKTFGTPGFFGVEFYYKPEHGKFYTKLCPAPVTPKYLIKEVGSREKHTTDIHFSKHTHKTHSGWLISQTLGFVAAFRLFTGVFRPGAGTVAASSFRHMDKIAKLTIEHTSDHQRENNLQIGFTISEMADRIEGVLKSTGLVKDFADIVYIVGHGSSTINNPHYSAYDCGACCGRPGSVNARVFSAMANNNKVRTLLRERGIEIPESTQFIGALHDTTRDEIVFYDEESLNDGNKILHQKNQKTFNNALDLNSKERSRRFMSIDSRLTPEDIHQKIRMRSDSLFEPRPELNHATNALCIVGRRELSKGIFLDRRSFLNSFDYRVDPEGKYLLNILKAAAPVCGGINLEYFFSRVDNTKLGAGTKLPHNVMGLIGVANGTDGDLRTGLPSQMIEVHDPVRLIIIVEHFNEVILNVLQRSPETFEWFKNEWVHLASVNPETNEISWYRDGEFHPYTPLLQSTPRVNNLNELIESEQENFPVYLIS